MIVVQELVHKEKRKKRGKGQMVGMGREEGCR
jgi:hypothetical protein